MTIDNFDFDSNLESAKARAEQMVNNGLYSRFGLSREKRVEKALIGCMGELAFEHWLKTSGYSYEVDQSDFSIRNSDEFDFKIDNYKIDIKVAKKSTPNAPADG